MSGMVCSSLVFLAFGFLLLTGLPMQANAATTVKSLSNLGIVGWWPLNEGTSTIAHDISGYNNNGTLRNGSLWTLGKRGDAMILDGVNDYVEVPASTPLVYIGGDITFSAWINPDSTETNGSHIFSKPWNGNGEYNYRISYDSGRTVTLNLVGATTFGYTTTQTLPRGQWSLVTVTVSSAKVISVYFNGQLVGSTSHTIVSWTPPSGNTSAPLCIGTLYPYGEGWAGNSSFSFNGKIDDARIYSKVLSATEVATLYGSGEVTKKTISQNGLVAWWKFDEATSTRAVDYSGNGYTAPFNGSPLWVTGKFGAGLNTGNTNSDFAIAPSVSLGSTWTASTWFKYPLSSLPVTWNTLFRSNGAGDDHQVIIQKSTNLLGMYDNTTGTGFRTSGFVMSTLTSGWHHLVIVGSGGVERMYIDGVYVGQTDKQSTGNIYAIGNYQGCCQNWGTLDDVRIYNRALSTTEITALYKESAININHTQNDKLTNGLVGYWSFNGADMNWTSSSAGIAYDRSGNGNNATFVNMNQQTSVTSGAVGQAVAFNGSSSYVEVSNSASLNPSNLTVSTWAKSNTATWNDFGFLVSKRDVFVMHPTQSATAVSFYINNGAWISASCTPANAITRWNLYTMTWDGTTLRCYINGVAGGTAVPGGSINTSDTGVIDIGRDDGSATRYFNGSMDETRMYNRALSASEVKQLYLMGK